jgi:hypothetical protein
MRDGRGGGVYLRGGRRARQWVLLIRLRDEAVAGSDQARDRGEAEQIQARTVRAASLLPAVPRSAALRTADS